MSIKTKNNLRQENALRTVTDLKKYLVAVIEFVT